MKKSVRGQSSIEFLFVTGVGLLLITVVTYAYLQYNNDSQDKARVQQANYAGALITQYAGTIYTQGTNSWRTIDVDLPKGTLALYTVENDTLVIEIATARGIVAQPVFSTTPIVGVRSDGAKMHVDNGSVAVHDGQMKLRLTSLGAVVQVQAVS